MTIEYLSFMWTDCHNTYLALYENPRLSSEMRLRYFQCANRTVYGESIAADWNTLSVIWQRGVAPKWAMIKKIFVASYKGMALEYRAAKSKDD